MKKIALRKSFSILTLVVFLSSGNAWTFPVTPQLVFDPVQNPSGSLNIALPENLGKIEETFTGSPDQPAVIYIQDAHANPSAQKNIKSILERLAKDYHFTEVGVEGADSPINPELLDLLPDKELNLKTARELLEEGRLSGTELFALEAQTKNSVVGVDERHLYRKNLKAYRHIAKKSSSALSLLESWKVRLREIMRTIYDPRLRELEDRKEVAGKSSEFTLAYVHCIAKLADRILGINLNQLSEQVNYPNTLRMLALAHLEKNQDRALLEKEIVQIKSILEGELKPGPEKVFLLTHLGQNRYKGSARRYFERLYAATEGIKISWGKFPQYRNFSATLIAKEELSGPELFEELDGLEKKIYDALLDTEKAKQVYVQSEVLSLLIKLLQLEATRSDVHKLSRILKVISLDEIFESFSSKEPAQFRRLKNLVREALEFYDLARKRDRHFVNQITRHMTSKKLKKMVLVTGGFHREGVTRLLKKKGISYAVISPSISGVYSDRYRRLMTETTLASLSPLEVQTVDLPKPGSERFLGPAEQGITALLHHVSLGMVLALETQGGVTLERINQRLQRWIRIHGGAFGNVSSIRLEAATPSRNGAEFLYRITYPSREVWVSASAARSLESGELNIRIRGLFPVTSNSLGIEYGSKKIRSLEPVRLAINVGAPDPRQSQRNGLFYQNGDYLKIRNSVVGRSNFDDPRLQNTSFNRMFDSLIRNLVGDPNISLTDIFGVQNPELLRQFIEGNAANGSFNGEVVLQKEAGGSSTLIINGTQIRIHSSIPTPQEINKQGINHLVDLADSQITHETHKMRIDRLAYLQEQSGLKKVIIVNPDSDPPVARHITPVVVGHNDEQTLAKGSQMLHMLTPTTQGVIQLLGLLKTSSLKPQILNLSDISANIITSQGDRELTALNEGGVNFDLIMRFFPEFAPKQIQSRPVDIESAPIRGGSAISITVELDPKLDIMKKRKEMASRAAALDKQIKAAKKEGRKDEQTRLEAEKLKIEGDRKKGIRGEKDDFIEGIIDILKRTAGDKNLDFMRFATKREYLNSAQVAGDTSQIIIDEDLTDITPGGQLNLNFWIPDSGMGVALSELLKRSQTQEEEGEISQDQLDALQTEFEKQGERKGANVIPFPELEVPERFLTEGDEIKAGILGAGVIGRHAIRQVVENPNYRLVFINGWEIKELDDLIGLLNNDPVYGPSFFYAKRKIDQNRKETNVIQFFKRKANNQIEAKPFLEVPVFNIRAKSDSDDDVERYKYDLRAQLPLKGVETIIHAATVYQNNSNPFANTVRDEKIRRVLITAPKDKKGDVDATIVYGANNKKLTEIIRPDGTAVIAGASCTTNAMLPVIKFLESLGDTKVLSVNGLTKHAATPSQGKFRGGKVEKGGRAAIGDLNNTAVPEDSGADKAVVEVLPWLKGRIKVRSIRVANQVGSLVETTIKIQLSPGEKPPTEEEVNRFFEQLAQGKYKGVIGFWKVNNSSQILGKKESTIVDPSKTHVVVNQDGTVSIKVGMWYDNELSFTRRMIDLDLLAAKVQRGIKTEEIEEEVPSLALSAVKLPGNRYLRPGSPAYRKIMAEIAGYKAGGKVSDLARDRLKLGLTSIRRLVPSIPLKEKERAVFGQLFQRMTAIADRSVAPKEPIQNLYDKSRAVKDIEIKLVDLADEIAFRTAGGNYYFAVSEYLESEQKLVVYLPQKFSEKYLDVRENAAQIQLVMMILLQEALGISYPEALIAISHFNSNGDAIEAGAMDDLPDLVKAMLNEMKERAARGNRKAQQYINRALQSEVAFSIDEEMRRRFKAEERTDAEIRHIKAQLDRMAALINRYVRPPAGVKPMPASSKAQITRIDDALDTEMPTKKLLAAKSPSRQTAVAMALPLATDGFIGALKRTVNGVEQPVLEALMASLAHAEGRAAIEATGRKTRLLGVGGPVVNQAEARFQPDQVFSDQGQGQEEETVLLINPLEGKPDVLNDEPGAYTTVVSAEDPKALLGKFPITYVNVFAAHLSRSLSKSRISEIKAKLEKDRADGRNPFDPDGDPRKLVRDWVELNGKSLKDAVVHVLDRKFEKERIRMLRELESEGLTIEGFDYGTFEPAHLSAWGEATSDGKQEKLHIYLGTSGAEEIQTVANFAGKEHSFVAFRPVSREGLSREGADIMRPEDAYNYPREEIDDWYRLRPEDVVEILPDFSQPLSQQNKGKKIFYAGIIGEDRKGVWEATIVIVTDSKFFGLPGIKKVGERTFEITLLRIVRISDDDENPRVARWVERYRVKLDVKEEGGIVLIAMKAPKPFAKTKKKARAAALGQALNILTAVVGASGARPALGDRRSPLPDSSIIFAGDLLPSALPAPAISAVISGPRFLSHPLLGALPTGLSVSDLLSQLSRETPQFNEGEDTSGWFKPLYSVELEPSVTITVSDEKDRLSILDEDYRGMIQKFLKQKPGSIQWFIVVGPKAEKAVKELELEFKRFNFGKRVRFEAARNEAEVEKVFARMIAGDLKSAINDLGITGLADIKQPDIWNMTTVRASVSILDRLARALELRSQIHQVESVLDSEFLRGKSPRIIGGAALLDATLAYFVGLSLGNADKLQKQLPDQSYTKRGRRYVLEPRSLTDQVLTNIFTNWMAARALGSSA